MLVWTDSQLVASQIKGNFQTEDTLILKYLQWDLQFAKGFTKLEVTHIHREENTKVDLLARLAKTKGSGLNRTVIQETLETPSIKVENVMVLENTKGWMTPIIQFLTQDKILKEETEVGCIKRVSSWYLMLVDQLYKMSRSTLMLRCVTEEVIYLIMKEVHEGVCEIHIKRRALCGKILTTSWVYYKIMHDT